MDDERWAHDAPSAAAIADVTAEALLGSVLDTMPTGLFTVDKRGLITSWNRAMEQMTGFAASEALGRDCSILQGDTCSGTACGDAEMRGCPLFQDRTEVERRCSIRRRDGESLPVLKKMRVMRGERGKIVGGVECLTDLSQMLSLEAELTSVRREATGHARFGLVGHHPSMQRLGELVELAGRSNASVLIQGETGTGKEIVARAIFEASARRDKPFIRVSCAALTETLLESELFGHVRGAFTGAVASRVGRFEAADGGTASASLESLSSSEQPAAVAATSIAPSKRCRRFMRASLFTPRHSRGRLRALRAKSAPRPSSPISCRLPVREC